jgi:magnesium chelatase family protein
MSLALVRSRAPAAGRAPEVIVEVNLANGLPAFGIVGLPDLEVRESRERVRAALENCGLDFPVRRITVNLAPADLPKEPERFDLPIALGILAASGQLPVAALHGREFAGELSLSGELRPMRGAFAMACGTARGSTTGTAPASDGRLPELYLPLDSALDAALVPGVHVFGAPDLRALLAHLAGEPGAGLEAIQAPCLASLPADRAPDLADVIGQAGARRALEIAAAGHHALLMSGPPGAGKSMLAARLPGLLPPMNDAEALDSAAILSSSRLGFNATQWRRRPFRAPHHSSSAAALIGGRNPPQPGEITLAHLGVLFLDELPEFDRRVLETLREPLEAGHVTISRAAQQADFPAACLLVAAMNPCPCGWQGDPSGRCRCTPDNIARYRRRLSGPLLDRIDLQILVPMLTPSELAERARTIGEPSAEVAARVARARQRQYDRQGKLNHMLSGRETDIHCPTEAAGENLLRAAGERYGWSGRAHYRVLKVARTIADLAGRDLLDAGTIAEAVRYRSGLLNP